MASHRSAMEELKEIEKVLTNLYYTESQVESSVLNLGKLIYNNLAQRPDNSEELQQLVFETGIVKALMGILGSCSSHSLLAKSAWCVSLLAHGNEDGRSLLGELGAMPLLVDLLSPRSCKESCVCWHHDWVKVYEQVLIAMRKLTYMNENNQQQLAVIGGIKLVIEISVHDNFLCNFNQFPQITKLKLEEYVLNKKLISRVAPVPDDRKRSVCRLFSALSLSDSSLADNYPVFSIDLFSTGNKSVSDSLIKEGVACPSHTPFPKDSTLTHVVVTCVEDGGHVWCQFCTEKPRDGVVAMTESLHNLPPPSSCSPSHPLLAVGDVYALYYDPSMFTDHRYLETAQWVRTRLISMEELSDGSSKVQLLTVDYGFTVTVPRTHLTALPSACRGIPPRAIPCELTNVQPLATSEVILENASAVLRNIAFESLAFRCEIMAFGGAEALLRIIRYPHKPTVLQSLGALRNIAVSKQLRGEMGKKGAVRILLEMCRENSDIEILEQVVVCLVNLSIGCHDNITRVMQGGGVKILTELSSAKQPISGTILHRLRGLLQSVDVDSTYSDPQNRKKISRLIYQARRRANGERSCAKPVLYCPESDSEYLRDEGEDDMDICGTGLEIMDYQVTISGAVSQSTSYTINSQLSVCEDSCHSFISVDSIDNLKSTLLRRTVCAFVNTGQQCTVYIGVAQDGIVRGVSMDKKKRDVLIVAIDNLMSKFTPEIHHNLYNISFVPVQRASEGVFVVELVVKESMFHQVYTIQERTRQGDTFERCYYRIGPSNENVTFQELQDIVALEEGSKYECVVSALEDNIKRFKGLLETNCRNHHDTRGSP